jgi:hypothetical protein
MEMLNKEIKEATKKRFDETMEDKVTLLFFTQEPRRLVVPEHLKGQECLFCKETKALLEELRALSDKIELVVCDFLGDKEKSAELRIDKIPATAVLGKEDYGIRFFGIPSGYEYASLIEATKFPHLAQKYNVFGVPKTVINENIFIDGVVSEEVLLEHVLKSLKPQVQK